MNAGRVGLRALLPYLSRHRRTLAVVAALSLVSALASLAQPVLVRVVLDAITARQPVAGPVVLLVTLLLTGAALAACATSCCGAPPRAWC